jgi:two-component system NtrC family response regulator
LQEKRFRPVGRNREAKSDFRIIAATNKNLDEEVQRGKFREDLLFRLKAMNIVLPPLRCRKEDIRILAMDQVGKLSIRYEMPEKGIGTDFLEVLEIYGWPGNVRELFNVMERAFVVAGKERTLYAMHLPKALRISAAKASIIGKMHPCPQPQEQKPPIAAPLESEASSVPTGEFDTIFADKPPSLKAFKALMEKRYLEQLIAMNGEDLKSILNVSGLSRSHLYALLKKNGITFKQN